MVISKVRLFLLVVLLKIEYNQGAFKDSTNYNPYKTVELAVFIDQYLYHYWFSLLRRSSSSPLTLSSSTVTMNEFIRAYLDTLLESLNLIYAHPSLASSSSSPVQEVPLIEFQLAHTEIFWKRAKETPVYSPVYKYLPPSTPSQRKRKNYREAATLSAGAPEYLEAFCDFANKENWNGNRWDHALLLTGVDLKFSKGGNYAVAGISWDNSMCNKTYSCSVVEGKTFRSVMTAVHEIGHSLGMEHDGKRYNFQCPPTGYIMSHAGGGEDLVGKIAWSPCSKHNLKAFLATAPNVLSNQVACLNNKPNPEVARSRIPFLASAHLDNKSTVTSYSTRGTNYGGYRDRNGKNIELIRAAVLPGNRFSVIEQCKLGGGKMWRPSGRRAHVRKQCSMLYCNNTRTGELVPFHPALEGTPCGRNKVCKYGECVAVQKRF